MRALRGWMRVSTIGLTLLLVSPLLRAQGSSGSPQYRVSTHLVQFGVIARNRGGPAANLTKNDTR